MADVVENFRNTTLKHHEIDPCYCYSLPGVTWEAGLKHTGVKLDYISDKEMYLMFEQGIRGGFSGVLGDRYVKANNKYLPDFDETIKQIYLLYIDYNNLYGGGMSEKLPTGDFKWEEDENYYNNIPESRGCIVECDLEYTQEAKDRTFRFPLAPERKVVEITQLSVLQHKYLEIDNKKPSKEKNEF